MYPVVFALLTALALSQSAQAQSPYAGMQNRPVKALSEIGVTQAALRNAHLKYHLETVRILSADQTKRYSSLRGYDSEMPVYRHQH